MRLGGSNALMGSRPRDPGHGGARGEKERQERECLLLGCGLHGPPDRVAAGAAGGKGRLVSQRALVAFEGTNTTPQSSGS